MMKAKENKGLLHLKMVYKFSIVLLIGIGLFLIGRNEIGDDRIIESILFLYSISKTLFFFKLMFGRIRETAHVDLGYRDILTFIGYNTLLIVVSFAIDYLCLYEINQESFSGITTREEIIPHLVTFFYFSVAVFTTAGLGDIAPHTTIARLLCSSEMMISWFLVILVIANFTGIREALKNSLTAKGKEK